MVDDLRNYSIAETVERSKLSEATIWRRIRENKLRTVKNGRRRLVPASALRDFLASDVA